ncbi:EEIG1/EHBP1 N-terminal domain-containing protein [Phycomyces nitens]|nr:EEIG1/EHBP1 N-terminal domain-containing protein [Phycomyces nitens]
MPLSHFFISKHRKVDYEISILIHDLKNVPLVSGLYHIRWRMKHASHTNGSTQRAPIKDHSIYWNHPISTMVQLVIDKQHVLSQCEFKLEIYQELGSGKEAEMIGSLAVNLAEYATTGLTTRRYLLDQCKFNSTLKVNKMHSQLKVGPYYVQDK